MKSSYMTIEQVLDKSYRMDAIYDSLKVILIVQLFIFVVSSAKELLPISSVLFIMSITINPIFWLYYNKRKHHIRILESYLVFRNKITMDQEVHMAYMLRLVDYFGREYIDQEVDKRLDELETKLGAKIVKHPFQPTDTFIKY